MASKETFANIRVDIGEAFDEFGAGIANRRVLLGAARKASKEVMLPRVQAGYTKPNRITGALSKKSSSKVKGIWYKKSKTGYAIAGLKTKNKRDYVISGKKRHAIESWHLGLVNSGQVGKYRTTKGTVDNPVGKTLAGNPAWRIHDGVRYDSRKVRKKTKKVVVVTRNPSRIAHLIEKGHKWPRGGGKTTAFNVITNAYTSGGKASQVSIMREISSRAKKAAEIAQKKAEERAKRNLK